MIMCRCWIAVPLLIAPGGACGESPPPASGSQTESTSGPTDDGESPDTTSDEAGSGSDTDTAADSTADTTDSTGTATRPSGSTTAGPAPLAASDDTFFTRQDVALSTDAEAGLLANDDATGGTVSAPGSTVAGGNLDVAADGGFEYTPPDGFWGRDSFEYTVQGPLGDSDTATATLFVAPVHILLSDVAGGSGGFALDGLAAGDRLGVSVGPAGDFDGDGAPDLAVGASSAGEDPLDGGLAYVVFGGEGVGTVDLSDPGDAAVSFSAAPSGALAGRSARAAGDVDGDGAVDLVVGDPFADAAAGAAYVVWGGAPVSGVLGSDGAGFTIAGGGAEATLGVEVSGGGDVNGDGLADVIVGAPFGLDVAVQSGRAYVVFGKADEDPVDVAALGGGGFSLVGENIDNWAGLSVAAAGDVNDDGLDDVIIGAPRDYDFSLISGRAYVVFGKADSDALALGDLRGAGFAIDADIEAEYLGWDVAGVGDVDGDGLPDVVVGGPRSDGPAGNTSGQAFVVFGKANASDVSVGALGSAGFVIHGEAEGDQAGFAVAGAGDINGDGLADLLVGAPQPPFTGAGAGRAYVVYGKADTGDVNLASLGTSGITMEGEAAEDQAGFHIAGVGDVNADGYPDVMVGAPDADPNGESSGRAYVVFGVPTQ